MSRTAAPKGLHGLMINVLDCFGLERANFELEMADFGPERAEFWA